MVTTQHACAKCASALICTHWGHSQDSFVKGLNFVSLLCQAGPVALLTAVELIEKNEAVVDGYAPAEKLNPVLHLAHRFVMALESSHTVAHSESDRTQGQFQALDTLPFSDGQPRRVFLRSVEPTILVSRQVFTNKDGSQGCYLVSSNTNLNKAQLMTIYERRWNVEKYHKSLQQNASMDKSPTKTPDTQANHFLPPPWPTPNSKYSNCSTG